MGCGLYSSSACLIAKGTALYLQPMALRHW